MIILSPNAEIHIEPVAKNVSDKSFAYKATDAVLGKQASMHYNVGNYASVGGAPRQCGSRRLCVCVCVRPSFLIASTRRLKSKC